MLTATKTQTDDLMRALRNWHPSHNEMVQFCAVANSATRANQIGLSEKCRSEVADLFDQIAMSVESDLIDQQSEQTWANRVRSPLGQRFPEVGQLDALTIRRSA